MPIPDQIRKQLMEGEEVVHDYEHASIKHVSGVVLTNKRLIYYKRKMIGIELKDYSWPDLHNVSIKEGLVFSEIKFEFTGDDIEFDKVHKDAARKLSSTAKELKAKAHEAFYKPQVIVQQEVATPQDDPVTKLKQLKDMLDANLISQAEYDSKKTDILSRM